VYQKLGFWWKCGHLGVGFVCWGYRCGIFPLWCVIYPLYFLLSHMYSFFTIYPEHSYGGTIVVLNRKYVLFKSHRQSSPQFVPYMFWGSHGILIGKCCLGCICLVFVFGCSSLVWDDTPILVFLNSFVMMLASFPMYINVGHFFLLSFFLFLCSFFIFMVMW